VPPMGGLYQCRLFFDGQGNASGTGPCWPSWTSPASPVPRVRTC
jgi:hypothetical protein